MNVFAKIMTELERADRKYPPMSNHVEGLYTLKCEVTELEREVMRWMASLDNVDEPIQKEAVQVAAMAIKFLRDCCKIPLDSVDNPQEKVPTTISQRGQEWVRFSAEVLKHIETYTVPQYGDKGNDRASDYTLEKIEEQISRYCDRMGTNARPGEQTRDFLKIAHYASMGYFLS